MLIISYFLTIALILSIILMLLFKVRPLFSHQKQRKPSSPSGENEFSRELTPQKDQISKNSPNITTDTEQRVQMVLFAKNPTCLYAYGPPSLKWGSGTPVLRVYQITDRLSQDYGKFLFDLEIEPDINSWFINVPHDNSLYYVILGERKEDGTFHDLLHSNLVETPRASLSAALDASWIPCDVYRNLGDISHSPLSSVMLKKSERTDH